MEQEIREIARQEALLLIEQKLASLNQKPKYVSLKEAKDDYHIFGATLYRKIDSGLISLVKVGGKSFLIREELEKLFVKVK
jgi:hypothetical protein